MSASKVNATRAPLRGPWFTTGGNAPLRGGADVPVRPDVDSTGGGPDDARAAWPVGVPVGVPVAAAWGAGSVAPHPANASAAQNARSLRLIDMRAMIAPSRHVP
ncbi:hypothetical protein AB0M36_06680 [Actinoplanes sp. NPDC051346]|uniref:hypothetical protein n=1 Tax=Actinoplanes sp. NPDC051346 TaxID=3155048 RepID=UPI003418D947